MEEIYSEYFNLLKDINFKTFQNNLSQKIYDVLGQGYSNKDNEVSIVTKLVSAINNMQFNKIKFYAHKIHGARSYVEFNYRDKPITKEIADMIIISIASYKRVRLLQKITFIQNKVDSKGKWEIDDEQLFLLKNFPKFSGNKGIFRSFSTEDILFFNYSRCLGAFGLFMNPGEMVFLSAPLLAELKKGTNLAMEEVSVIETLSNLGNRSLFLPSRFLFEDVKLIVPDFNRSGLEYVITSPLLANWTFPFLGNSIFTRDVHDFTREWTQFNIGEPTYVFGTVTNPILDKFTNFLLRTIGIQEHVDLPSEDTKGEFNTTMVLLVMHIDLGRGMKG